MRTIRLVILLTFPVIVFAQTVTYEMADDSLPDVPKGTVFVKDAKGDWYTAGALRISAKVIENETPLFIQRVVTFSDGDTYFYVDAAGQIQSRVKGTGGLSGAALDAALESAANIYETLTQAQKASDSIKIVNQCKGNQRCVDKTIGGIR